jgi:hypothetical protein
MRRGCRPGPRPVRFLNALGPVLPELWGGSADLAESNNTTMKGADSFGPLAAATGHWNANPVVGSEPRLTGALGGVGVRHPSFGPRSGPAQASGGAGRFRVLQPAPRAREAGWSWQQTGATYAPFN